MKTTPYACAAAVLGVLGTMAGCKDQPAPGSQPPSQQPPQTSTVTNASVENGLRDNAREHGPKLATWMPAGTLETVALFDVAMPAGVTVSHAGRIFVNFPRWGDDVQFTVAEVRNGNPVAFPDEAINRVPTGKLETGFVSVQSVVVDPSDRLWVLDTGSIKMAKSELGGPKLVGIDLQKNAVFKTIVFPRDVALATSYPNDVRFDLKRGKGGMAFITDSAAEGSNGIIVVDLDSGKSWRKLVDHPSTKGEKGFLPIVEGRPVMSREPGKPPKNIGMGSDGIAISGDGKLLYYCPLASRRLYSVSTDALANEKLPDAEVAKTVKDLGEKSASDGLESDAEGRVYVTSYEGNSILRRKTDGMYETLVSDTRALWPDTLSLANDGFLYFTANQLHRQPQYNDGKDLRQKPYVLFRVKVDGTPVSLK
ncbi:MAG: major royal jelly protein [Myxococcaceae bacterium]|nr:major royal jelly protein [Myxococcaceae bacterium]